MAGKRTNTLRAYHLLIVRGAGGYCWQVRYDRHANPVERGAQPYATHAEAIKAGEVALSRHQTAANNDA